MEARDRQEGHPDKEPGLKICSKCKNEKQDNRYNVDQRNGGLRSICKDCYNEQAKAIRKTRKAEHSAWNDVGAKVCGCCKEEKQVTEFSKDKRIPGKYRHNCMACEAEKLRTWRKSNPDRYYENHSRRAKIKRSEYNYYSAKRRGRILKATPAWVGQDEFEQLAVKEAYSLAIAREKSTGVKWEVDHIIPLAGKKVSGLHVSWNLRVITKEENRAKRNLVTDTSLGVRHG